MKFKVHVVGVARLCIQVGEGRGKYELLRQQLFIVYKQVTSQLWIGENGKLT